MKKLDQMVDVHGDHSHFSVLPDGCISHIISLTSPKDACRSSAVSCGFKFASESDTVWERFLPEDYEEIISKSVTPLSYSSKKELFTHLCRSPILLNGGTLSFWLSKSSGKKCYMLCAREISIVWQETPTYWKWTSSSQSRFSEVAELKRVCWLKIRGKMQTKMLSSNTKYAAYLVFWIENNSYGLESASKVSIKFASSNSDCDACEDAYLTPIVYAYEFRSPRWARVIKQREDGRHPEKREDGWMEMYLGQFFVDNEEDEIEMQLCETKTLNWKKGLVIEGIELRPKED